MRRPLKATSRSRRQGDGNVTLFPFLAVLICTMGALILLLVVIAQQARVQAAQAASADDEELADRKKELETAEQSIAWQAEQVKIARERTESQLADARLELGHLEDHANRLARELVRLEATWRELDSLETDGGRRRAESAAELEQLKTRIDRARKLLADAQADADFRRKSYAVVPYEGPNGTRRRPIYIECRADAVLLQPEGVVLTDKDFAGPLGPGNPLDVALRAETEYLARQHADAGGEDAIEPYPLLLVRPEGIEAYYAARAAMQSWGSDFGYELIGDDWNLQFDPRDPALVQEITQAVATARARQQFLIAAAPGRYGGGSRPAYVARPYRGGVVRADGSRDDGSHTRADRSGGGFGQGGGSAGSPGLESPGLGSPGAGSPGLGTSGSESASSASLGPGSSTLGLPNSSGSNPLRDADGAFAAPPYAEGSQAPDATRGNGESTSAASDLSGHFDQSTDRFGRRSASGDASRGGQVSDREGTVGGRPSADADSSSPGATVAMRPGEWTPRPERGTPRNLENPQSGGTAPQLAKTRGRDWALPDAAGGSTPITRPIRVYCYPDRLEIAAESGTAGSQIVALTARTEETIDTFVSAVWDHMDSWGIAGNGMYWRPILNVRVAPGAVGRYADLKSLLDSSGLDVRNVEN
jgi:hypothetical protein